MLHEYPGRRRDFPFREDHLPKVKKTGYHTGTKMVVPMTARYRPRDYPARTKKIGSAVPPQRCPLLEALADKIRVYETFASKRCGSRPRIKHEVLARVEERQPTCSRNAKLWRLFESSEEARHP